MSKRISSGSETERLAAYSRAVEENGWIFVSGTIGIDPTTGQLPSGAESPGRGRVQDNRGRPVRSRGRSEGRCSLRRICSQTGRYTGRRIRLAAEVRRHPPCEYGGDLRITQPTGARGDRSDGTSPLSSKARCAVELAGLIRGAGWQDNHEAKGKIPRGKDKKGRPIASYWGEAEGTVGMKKDCTGLGAQGLIRESHILFQSPASHREGDGEGDARPQQSRGNSDAERLQGILASPRGSSPNRSMRSIRTTPTSASSPLPSR